MGGQARVKVNWLGGGCKPAGSISKRVIGVWQTIYSHIGEGHHAIYSGAGDGSNGGCPTTYIQGHLGGVGKGNRFGPGFAFIGGSGDQIRLEFTFTIHCHQGSTFANTDGWVNMTRHATFQPYGMNLRSILANQITGK